MRFLAILLFRINLWCASLLYFPLTHHRRHPAGGLSAEEPLVVFGIEKNSSKLLAKKKHGRWRWEKKYGSVFTWPSRIGRHVFARGRFCWFYDSSWWCWMSVAKSNNHISELAKLVLSPSNSFFCIRIYKRGEESHISSHIQELLYSSRVRKSVSVRPPARGLMIPNFPHKSSSVQLAKTASKKYWS